MTTTAIRVKSKTALLMFNSPLKFLRLSFIQAFWKKVKAQPFQSGTKTKGLRTEENENL
jgi:hypothetical protein